MLVPPKALRRGMEGLDAGRRHRVAQAGRRRAAARDQPGGGLLRRRARHLRADEPERDGGAVQEHHLHERGAHAGGRRLVGGHDRRTARRAAGLAGQRMDPGAAETAQGGASQRPIHRAGLAVPDDRSGLGEPERRADQRDRIRGPARGNDPAGLPGLQLELGRVHRGHDGLGDDRGRGGHHGQGPPGPDGDAAVLRLPHGRLFPRTGSSCRGA